VVVKTKCANQSGTGYLDAFIRHERGRIDMAWHEAGHLIAGVLNGGVVASAAVVDGRVKSGLVSPPRGETTFTGGTLGSSKHAMTAYAGPWAQAYGRVRRRPNSHEVSAMMAGDRCKDREVLLAAGGVDVGEPVTELLQRFVPSLSTLAELLWRTGKASQSDVLRAMGLSEDASTRAVELSMIRSGAEPGTFKVSRPS
jgi:hypothetical protein